MAAEVNRIVYLLRKPELKDRTLGNILVYDGLKLIDQFSSLELPDRGNKKNISRYPAGEYILKPRWSKSLGDHLEIVGVPGRTICLVHRGCFPSNTEGCTLCGTDFKDIDGDSVPDVCNSRTAIARLCELIRVPTRFIVVDA